MQDKLIWTRDKFQVDLVFFPLYEAVCSFKRAVGDRPQGVAGDCNSLAETHAAEVAENISISGTLAFTK